MELDSGMTLYEYNKAAVAAQGQMTIDQVTKAMQEVVVPYLNQGGKYFMLLNNETHYYTVWDMVSRKVSSNFTEMAAADILDVILSSVGLIYSIALDDNGAIEIWVQNYSDNELHVYYFFNYDYGVIVL